MNRLLLFFTLVLLSACMSGPYPVSSPYYVIPEGSRLRLKQALTIPPGKSRVYIQYGKVVTGNEYDQYYPHCWFLSWKISTGPSTIKPDEFVVTKTRKLEEYVARQNHLLLASLAISGTDMFSGATAIDYSTELTIHSDKQPDIRRFACSYWEDPADAQHLTLAQINKALGGIAEIQLANTQ